MEEKKFTDILFDEENTDNIFLDDKDGNELELEQVAVVDIGEKYYAILHPVSAIEGVGEDEALVFEIDEEKDCLKLVSDDDTIEKAFDIYYELIDALDDEE